MNEFVLSGVVALSGAVLTVGIGKWLDCRPAIVLPLYVWHTALGIFYSNCMLTYGGDALDYYQRARFDYVQPNLGTARQKWMLVPALMLVLVGAWSAISEKTESDRTKFRRLAGAPQAVR